MIFDFHPAVSCANFVAGVSERGPMGRLGFECREASEALGEDAAGEKASELLRDEAGEARALAVVARECEEGLEVLFQHAAAHARFGAAAGVDGRHAPAGCEERAGVEREP